jgi:hypothetical protein
MTKQTNQTQTAPDYSSLGRGEQFLANLIKELEKEKGKGA